jgi:hypothetical protein
MRIIVRAGSTSTCRTRWRRHLRSYLPHDGMYIFYGLIDLTAATELEQSFMEIGPGQIRPEEKSDGAQEDKNVEWLGGETWEDSDLDTK